MSVDRRRPEPEIVSIGCCGAPMMVVDGHYHEKLDIKQLDAILDGLE